jgi:hypothetical protein
VLAATKNQGRTIVWIADPSFRFEERISGQAQTNCGRELIGGFNTYF